MTLWERLQAEADKRSKAYRKSVGHVVANMTDDGGTYEVLKALCAEVERLEARVAELERQSDG